MADSGRPRIAIVGAGVSGLSVGLCVKESLRKAVEVTIISDRFSPSGITSDGAGAMFMAGMSNYKVAGNAADKFRKDSKRWSTVTFHRLTNLYQNRSQRKAAGIEEFTMFLCYNEKHELPWFRDLYSDFKVLSAAEAGLPSRLQTVWSFTTFCIQPLKYLQWLTVQFRELGGLIVQSKVNSLKELVNYDIIINCTGLGAKELVGDHTVVPVCGQMVEVDGPKISNAVYNRKPDLSHIAYFFPRNGRIVLGGSAHPHHWSTEVDTDLTEEIYRKCVELCPQLEGSKVVREWVCQRPVRDTVRLEVDKEFRPFLIHNYGHGGQGYILSWGCATDVTALVQQHIQGKMKVTAKL